MELGRFRVGLRVSNPTKAAHFYRGLGFTEVGTVPGDDGRAVMTILQREGVLLLVDALVGMPFAATEREHQVRNGPRGLGVALGLGVDDLAATYAYCHAQGCTITAEPTDAAYGDRVFECIDPFGYLWEMSQPVAAVQTQEALHTLRDDWSKRSTSE
ncbi:MAG TPA: VOC family protein [Microlunatus sp.]